MMTGGRRHPRPAAEDGCRQLAAACRRIGRAVTPGDLVLITRPVSISDPVLPAVHQPTKASMDAAWS
jgi:hypothetical protein